MAAPIARPAPRARWWEVAPALVEELEGHAFEDDPPLRRLSANEIAGCRDLVAHALLRRVDPRDMLVYQTFADGPFGRYRMAAILVRPPQYDPSVLCLDGPRGENASPHRNGELELCLYFPDDPRARRWTSGKGLAALLALGRQHLYAEDLWRHGEGWVLDEAPHGETSAVRVPGRNDPCTCGSGVKSKRCCWRD
jgi:hypothetical protein